MSETRDSVISEVEKSLITLRSTEQKLTEALIPDDVYTCALNMVISVEFETRYHNSNMFKLLLKREPFTNLSKAPEVITKWQAGLKVLLRYPMDLYLAPNRPELKTIKLTAGFYEYQINRRLTNAKEFLHEMRYEPHSRSPSEYILRNTSNLVAVITDLVVLHQDLEATLLVTEAIRNTCQSRNVKGREILLTDVLQSRQSSLDPGINGCVHYLMQDLSPPNMPITNMPTSDPLRSLTARGVVSNDGHANVVPTIKPRKNNPGLMSRSSDLCLPANRSCESSITSIPLDPSQLPPPVMTKSELMQMFETKPEDSAHRNKSHDSIFISSSGKDVESQLYRPFTDGGYTSVLFSIGGDDGETKGVSSYNTITESTDRLQSLHRRSSEGSLLDQTSSKSNVGKYYSPPTPQRYAPPPPSHYQDNLHGISSHNSNLPHPSNNYYNGYQLTNNTGGNRQHYQQHGGYGTPGTVQDNVPSKHYSHNHHIGDHYCRPPQASGANSSTWGGESPRQYLKQISEKESSHHNSTAGLHAMDLAVDPSTPRSWQCYRCKIDYASDMVGCSKCGELAPFIDTDGTPPLQTQHQYPVSQRIAMDYADIWECRYCCTKNNTPKDSACKECRQINVYNLN